MFDEGADWDAELTQYPRSILRDRCELADLLSRGFGCRLRFPILDSLRPPETKVKQ